MSPRPSHLQKLLRILRQMLLVLCGALGARAAELRARRDRLPQGHRRLVGMEKELRRIAWAQEVLADPALLEDAAFRGLAAERARVRADAGRMALVRRSIYPTALTRLCGAVPASLARREAERCTGCTAVAVALPGLAPRAAVRAHVRSAPAASRVKFFCFFLFTKRRPYPVSSPDCRRPGGQCMLPARAAHGGRRNGGMP